MITGYIIGYINKAQVTDSVISTQLKQVGIQRSPSTSDLKKLGI